MRKIHWKYVGNEKLEPSIPPHESPINLSDSISANSPHLLVDCFQTCVCTCPEHKFSIVMSGKFHTLAIFWSEFGIFGKYWWLNNIKAVKCQRILAHIFFFGHFLDSAKYLSGPFLFTPHSLYTVWGAKYLPWLCPVLLGTGTIMLKMLSLNPQNVNLRLL